MDKKKKMLPTVLAADAQGGASDPRPVHQPTSFQVPERLSKLMWFVDHVVISGASAQSLGVDTRSPNGDDHWWDKHGNREKRKQRRHTAMRIHFDSAFPFY